MADGNNALTAKLLDARVKGKNYFEIEAMYGIPAAEAKQMVNEILEEVAERDPVEMRYLVQLRLEAITANLWEGVEAGSFKHADSILKAAEQLAVLMDLNQNTIKQQLTIISDEETRQLFQVLKLYSAGLYQKVAALPLSQKARLQLEEWPEWTADAATQAVEEAVYAEVEE
jgi:hypothetical protein